MEDFIKTAIEDLQIMYCAVEQDKGSNFLFSVRLADNMEMDRLKVALEENNFVVLIQDDLVNIPSSYQTKEHIQTLINCFRLSVSF